MKLGHGLLDIGLFRYPQGAGQLLEVPHQEVSKGLGLGQLGAPGKIPQLDLGGQDGDVESDGNDGKNP